MRRTIVAVVGLGILVAAGAAISQTLDVQSIKDRGVLYVGFVNEAPFSFMDAKSDLRGIDVEIIKECAKALGIKEVLGVQNVFDGLIPGLASKRYDVVAAGLTYRKARAEVAEPSVPTYYLRTTAIVPKGNPNRLKSFEEFKGGTYKVGGVIGTFEYITMQKEFGLGDRLVGYEDNIKMYSDVEARRLGVAVHAEAVIIDYLKRNPNAPIEIPSPFKWVDAGRKSVLWFRKDAKPLVTSFDGCIKKMKADGSMMRILRENGYPADTVTPVEADLSDQTG